MKAFMSVGAGWEPDYTGHQCYNDDCVRLIARAGTDCCNECLAMLTGVTPESEARAILAESEPDIDDEWGRANTHHSVQFWTPNMRTHRTMLSEGMIALAEALSSSLES